MWAKRRQPLVLGLHNCMKLHSLPCSPELNWKVDAFINLHHASDSTSSIPGGSQQLFLSVLHVLHPLLSSGLRNSLTLFVQRLLVEPLGGKMSGCGDHPPNPPLALTVC